MVKLLQTLRLCDDILSVLSNGKKKLWRTADRLIFRVYSYRASKRLSSKLGTTRSKKPARARSKNYELLLNAVIKL
jgi:hypothetical protein